MAQGVSKLWTRRMTSRLQDIPALSPLYSTAFSPTSAFPTDGKSTSGYAPRLLASSPVLYTPTEAIGILLGKTPLEAAHSARLAIEAATPARWHARRLGGDNCLSSPCLSGADSGDHSSNLVPDDDWNSCLLHSLSEHHADLRLDIDTASLATEVALQALPLAEDPVRPDERYSLHRICMWKERLKQEAGASYHGAENDYLSPLEKGRTLSDESTTTTILHKHPRKGRARMSQEKRKRLARRKEREAMLIGVPSRPISAPLHPSRSPISGHPVRQAPDTKQSYPPWFQDFFSPPPPSKRCSLSLSDDASSRSSQASGASGDSLRSHATTYIATPSTSPECYHRREQQTIRQGDHQCRSLWMSDLEGRHVPRLALQPPSPTHHRLTEPFHPLVSPQSPPEQTAKFALFRQLSSSTTPMMRWSTTKGLMTSPTNFRRSSTPPASPLRYETLAETVGMGP